VIEKIEQKKYRIRECIALLREIRDECLERFDSDPIYRGAALHYLYLMADSCIAMAEMTIRYKDLRPPQTYAESFDILGDAGVLEPEFAYSFSRIVGFRSFLAHDYEQVDGRRICGMMFDELANVELFLQQIAEAVQHKRQGERP
jgi:uncharacterized protein YutE (UPF0331/DUF86 family)